MINIDTKTGIKKITGELFRLVYMEKTHITTIEGTAKLKTWTKQEVEEFTTEKQADDRKKKLDLKEIDHDKKAKVTNHGK